MERTELEKAWSETLSSIKERTNKGNYNLWFRPIKLGELNDEKLHLMVPNTFMRDWLRDNYADVIERELHKTTGMNCSVVIEAEASPTPPADPLEGKRPARPAKRTVSRTTPRGAASNQTRLQLLNPRFTFDNFVKGPSNQFAFEASRAVANQPGGSYNPDRKSVV